MRIAVLGATGATGHQLALQAHERGHAVTAIARALDGVDVVVSGLGVSKGDHRGTLLAGARSLTAVVGPRIIWLGAFGTGHSAQAAGAFTRVLLGMVMKSELADKVAADQTILDMNGTVFHAGRLINGLTTKHVSVRLAQVPKRLMPRGISRSTVAAALLDEAENPTGGAQVLVPLGVQ